MKRKKIIVLIAWLTGLTFVIGMIMPFIFMRNDHGISFETMLFSGTVGPLWFACIAVTDSLFQPWSIMFFTLFAAAVLTAIFGAIKTKCWMAIAGAIPASLIWLFTVWLFFKLRGL